MNNQKERMEKIVFFCKYIVTLAIVLIPILIATRTGDKKQAMVYIGIGLLVYAAYLLLGYFLKWTHIFCYYQNMARQPLTPDEVDWSTLRPGDVYIIPGLYAALGVGAILFGLLSK